MMANAVQKAEKRASKPEISPQFTNFLYILSIASWINLRRSTAASTGSKAAGTAESTVVRTHLDGT